MRGAYALHAFRVGQRERDSAVGQLIVPHDAPRVCAVIELRAPVYKSATCILGILVYLYTWCAWLHVHAVNVCRRWRDC